MKRMRAMAAALVVSGTCARPALALEDKRLAWGRSDTNLHMGASFVGSFAATEFLKWQKVSKPKATLLSSLLVLSGGLLKEFVVDKSASGSDLMANGIGVGANALVQFTIRF